ncbi:Asp23/Gls24 family envelope stress response protein [Aliibacillus thermotolerans]|uniref:Asp23/Gls24 family envelope stress response protein n=1 Tax=Aliibacillus thermotolerans TaxID=1834418 RepID=A0ABW0U6X8_9BACI|nr:Asp23/Gls24 family envelope stress response protein [Aliibacillus thermotolerans]
MSEYRAIDLENTKNELGTIEIAPEVIEVIAGLAASEVEGVHSLRGSFATDVAERFGRKNHGKGVKVDLGSEESGTTIDISVTLRYGVSIPEVAKNIQENIHQAIQTMTAIPLEAINVHIVGVQLNTTEESEQS